MALLMEETCLLLLGLELEVMKLISSSIVLELEGSASSIDFYETDLLNFTLTSLPLNWL